MIAQLTGACLVAVGLLAPAGAEQPASGRREPAAATGQGNRPDARALQPVPPLPSARRVDEVRRFKAPEARQGVAVDEAHFYAVGNAHIAKYEKHTGTLVAEWKGSPGGPAIHVNSCIVLAEGLACAHSNYPAAPMLSSIEFWDPATLEHTASHSLGVYEGSLTWAIRKDGDWWLNFAHYGGAGGTPGKGPEWTTLVRFDDNWVRKAAYSYPVPFVLRLAPYSASGGNWGPDGLLYVTGHDQPELYVLRLPKMGSVLEWVDTIPAPIHGQAWVFDPVDPDAIWGIHRAAGEVVVGRLRP